MSSSSVDASFLIPYEYLYEHVFEGIRPLYYILVGLWIVTLFYCMYSIADRHFTWSLEHLSNALRLSPDLAGLTLLTFGNGAPDFFTAIFGASTEPAMILGSSVGAGLFTVTIVFGLVLLLARGPGRSRSFVLPDGNLREDPNQTETGLFKCSEVIHRIEPISFLRSAGMYLICVGLLFLFAFIKKIPLWLPLVLLAAFVIYLGSCIAYHFGTRKSRRKLSKAATEVWEEKHTPEMRMEAFRQFYEQSWGNRFIFALRKTCWESDWPVEGLEYAFRLAMVIIKAPINLALSLTILPIEVPEEATNAENFVALRFLHRLRCIVNPFFSFFWYGFLLGPALKSISWWIWLSYAVLSFIMLALLLVGTSWDAPPRMFPLHVLYAFCTCILWIYATSNELLACLSSTGSFLGISPTVMGIIVLAWGNSFGDLVADIAIAKNGSFETAVTAIFSGPVQNVLLTIGAGFLVAAIKSPHHLVLISDLKADIFLALIVLGLTILMCLMLVPFKFDFKVPRTFGFVLLAVYSLYFPFALIFGLGLIRIPGMAVNKL